MVGVVLVVALELGGLVLAAWLRLKGAVVETIGACAFVVQGVGPVSALICLCRRIRSAVWDAAQHQAKILLGGDIHGLHVRVRHLDIVTWHIAISSGIAVRKISITLVQESLGRCSDLNVPDGTTVSSWSN